MRAHNFYGDNMRWWYGEVVNVQDDPLQLGRAQVRIYGIHGPEIEDIYLPWASVIVPTTEAGVSGIGTNPGLKPGARVMGSFLDGQESQNPLIWGSVLTHEGSIMRSPSSAVTPGSTGVSGAGGGGGAGKAPLGGTSPGYPSDMSNAEIEAVITEEAKLRNIDPEVAIQVFRHEGAGSYQSGISRKPGKGTLNGREASFGPYQLFIGGGLGNDYQNQTGRNLITDNTREGITNQIRFSLDVAARRCWGPRIWYGFDAAYGTGNYCRGIGPGARAIGNWK